MQRHGTDWWVDRLEALKIGCGPINTLEKVFADPHVQARGVVVDMPHETAPDGVRVIANPVRLSRDAAGLPPAAAGAGRAHRRGAGRHARPVGGAAGRVAGEAGDLIRAAASAITHWGCRRAQGETVTIPAGRACADAPLALPPGTPVAPAIVALHGCGGPFPRRDRHGGSC